VRILVSDSARAPLRDADVALLKNGNEPVMIGRTDAAGLYVIRFEPEKATYSVLARQIGFAPATRTVEPTLGDTITVSLVLARGQRYALDTVRITERELPLPKRPFLGAEEIAADTHSILSLGDALAVLRADIAYQSYRCVSSGRARGPIVRGRIPPRRGTTRPPTQARVYVNGRWIPPEWDPWNSISSDHIAEIRYVNCNDKSIPGLPERAWASVYVTLKPGIGWSLRTGSYVLNP
jgi:hypothetical protein